MIAATPRRRRRLQALRSLLATLALLLPLLLATPAQAADPAPPADLVVTLTGATASGSTPDATVTVTGTIANPGPAAVQGVAAQLWRSAAPLRTVAEVDAALDAEVPPAGRAVAAPTATVDLGGTPLQPGASHDFTVHATLAELGLTTNGATFWVGANVQGRFADGPVTSSEARTLVTVPKATAPAITSVVELSARPRLVKPDLFVDDTLADELTGRLRTLLDAAAQPGVSRVVDPALVAEVADMADGYRVVVEGVESRPGTGRDVANTWLADLRRLPVETGHRSAFAQPDLAGAESVGGAALVERLLAASAPDDPLPLLVTLDEPDEGTLDAVSPLGAPVLAAPGTEPGAAALRPSWSRVDGTSLVTAVSPGSVLAGRQLADTPVNRGAALQAMAQASGTQVRLLTSEADVEADRAALRAGAGRRPLGALLGTTPEPWAGPLRTTGKPRVLTPGDDARLRAFADALAAYGAAAPASGVGWLADVQVARAASRAWAGHPEARAGWFAAVDARVGPDAVGQAIDITALPRFTMSSNDNEFPVTISNHLPDDVLVRVVGRSDTPQRIRLEPSEVVTVRAGSSTGVLLRAVATGNGVATAQLHAETTDGRRLTSDVAVVVEATNLGAVGWVIVIVSGVVLVVTTALRIRQVRQRNQGGVHGR